MGTPVLLAIDSSTELLCVAACSAQRSAAWCGEGGTRASQEMLARVRQVLDELSLTLADLDAVGFARGPGAFTGLRAACAVAQGLAFGLELPLVPVDSLLLVAEAARARHVADGEAVDVGVVMDARMGEVYAGRYVWDGAHWSQRQPPGLWSAADLPNAWQGPAQPAVWTGSGLRCLPSGHTRRELLTTDDDRPRALLALVLQGWRAGQSVAADRALPLYVRDKVALTSAERAAARVRHAG